MPRKELTSTQRAIIRYAREQGETLQTIADKIGCGKTTVGDTLRRLEATGTTSPQKRPGRPKLFDERKQASLKRLTTTGKNRRLTASQLQALWEPSAGRLKLQVFVPAPPVASPCSLTPTWRPAWHGLLLTKIGPSTNGDASCGVTSQHFTSSTKTTVAVFGENRKRNLTFPVCRRPSSTAPAECSGGVSVMKALVLSLPSVVQSPEKCMPRPSAGTPSPLCESFSLGAMASSKKTMPARTPPKSPLPPEKKVD
jgi:transposase